MRYECIKMTRHIVHTNIHIKYTGRKSGEFRNLLTIYLFYKQITIKLQNKVTCKFKNNFKK